MDHAHQFDLLGGAAEPDSECRDVGLGCSVDPERAYPLPVTTRSPASELLCHARLGAIVSVMTVNRDLCGSEDGCHGHWHCLTGKAPGEASCQQSLPF